jgi:uncharacterized protein
VTEVLPPTTPPGGPPARRTGGWLLLALIGGVAALLVFTRSLHPLPWPALLLIGLLLVVLPFLSLTQRREMEAQIREFPRRSIYLSSAVALWLLAAITIASALASGFDLRRMGLVLPEPTPFLGWTLALLCVCLAVPAASRSLRIPETGTVYWILPRTGREKLEFTVLSVTAGVAEEMVFRAFLVPALITLTGSTVVAVVASSLAFGSVHAYQGFVGILRTAVIGSFLALPLLVSGSIVPSMVAHALANIVIGVVLVDWFRRDPATLPH